MSRLTLLFWQSMVAVVALSLFVALSSVEKLLDEHETRKRAFVS